MAAISHRIVKHPELVAQDLLLGKNHAGTVGVIKLGMGANEHAELAKEHQPLHNFFVLGELFGGGLVNQQMFLLPSVQNVYAPAPLLSRLRERQALRKA